ncbi:TIGR01457 family HAD-type hydrolase [Virgibacillus sp. W0430]|uniref:TIGR01457 family HAD-type hydrolase n=1 Tax=Virgibacillus sp. W0430 TaxID=3391580 RepID=UPI003F478978
MKNYKGYLIDLDGTMYRGNERIEAAAEFINHLQLNNIPYLFLTNNSAYTQATISEKLNKMGIPSTEEHVFTTSKATAKYILQKKEKARCFVIGEEGLIQALNDEQLVVTDENCDFVISGIDRNITYEKLAKACIEVRNGATFISTNSDVAIPTERGLLPGNGALTSVITVSTGVEPIFIGKPETIIMNEAVSQLNVNKSDILMIGDNYDTDIQAGIQAGIDTLMVFTGVTQYEELPKLKQKPTYHVKNLAEWVAII